MRYESITVAPFVAVLAVLCANLECVGFALEP